MSNSMRFVTDLSKGVLGQPDSEELWSEIIAHIPDEVLLKPGVRILSVACGHCTEALLIAKRMLALGVSKEAVRDAIWLIDKYAVFTNFAKDKYGFKNVVQQDFLTWEPCMKFDVVVGNPPYQDATGQNTIYPRFYSKAVALTVSNGKVAMITPPAIIPGLWGVKNPDGIKISSPIQIDIIRIGQQLKSHFPGVGSEFCYFVLSNIPSENREVAIKTDSGTAVASGPLFPKVAVEKISVTQSILNKCFTFYADPYKVSSSDYGSSAVSDCNGTGLAVEAISSSGTVRTRPVTWIKPHAHYNRPKVIMPMYGKVAVVDYTHTLVSAAQEKTPRGDKLTGHNIMTVLTSSDFESEVLVDILNSSLQKFFSFIMSETRSQYVSFLKNFIGVPLDRTWTDAELYAHFGLTEEEIAHIEATVK